MLFDARPPRGSPDSEPWKYEPDRVAWRDPSTGLQCLILRSGLGSLCGYVRVPRDHPMHGMHRQRPVWRLLVHGGITFAGRIRWDRKTRGHWFGFDCAHAFDLVPGMLEPRRLLGMVAGAPEKYRTVQYVRYHCELLATQLARKGRHETSP
ncbi:MAG TPA: hypothetical protein VJO99_07090 [Burkholderiaceae bacterium]|nr:hypothetical protein [Burkholderiaceae bacterium]